MGTWNLGLRGPGLLLRLEGLAAFLLALLLYRELAFGWLWFALLFFFPDLSLVAYLAGARLGAVFYNSVHTYVLPAALWAAGFVLEIRVGMALGLIWAAHIGLDRALGFGLKYASGPRPTHLQRV
ncbi:MAG: hypothetical protein KatS3mg081_1409 [Gemmatimonadales bacterium]|nr:hypothetical protein HRbin33_00627 [bacterium HR33]GIW52054.1 MAG: hypothetical protein KatS3mg081_1409 [Gemmatimonadales bacterium]